MSFLNMEKFVPTIVISVTLHLRKASWPDGPAQYVVADAYSSSFVHIFVCCPIFLYRVSRKKLEKNLKEHFIGV